MRDNETVPVSFVRLLTESIGKRQFEGFKVPVSVLDLKISRKNEYSFGTKDNEWMQ